MGCVNAIGQAIPPMVIFEGKYLNLQWTTGEVPGTRYGMSNKEWTDQELFHHWLQDHFLKYAVKGRPLLLLDGHSSHFEPQSVEIAKNEGVVLFCLPPHTTQNSQPLDCTIFGLLKRHWSQVCHEHFQRKSGVVISKLNFLPVFAEAWLKALTLENIVAGFWKCGIYPFNREAIPLVHETTTEGVHLDESSTTSNSSLGNNSTTATGDTEELSSESTGSIEEFTPQEIDLFTRRYEEGYNVYINKRYVTWLQLHHPEALPDDMSISVSSSYSMHTFVYICV